MSYDLENSSQLNAADRGFFLDLLDNDSNALRGGEAIQDPTSRSPRYPRLTRPTKAEVDLDSQSPIYKTDWFRMYHFKTHECAKPYSHCYKHCPFAHKNEYARRRSPEFFSYSCLMCPDQQAVNNGKNSNSRGYASKCYRGDDCAYSHSNLERHLHPDMYRTQICKATSCQNAETTTQTRPVCFFAHNADELRTVEKLAVPLECMEPFMFTPGTIEHALAGKSDVDVCYVDRGVFQRVASNRLTARTRAKQARLQLDTIFAVKAAAKARLQATWDPYFDIKKELGQLSLI